MMMKTTTSSAKTTVRLRVGSLFFHCRARWFTIASLAHACVWAMAHSCGFGLLPYACLLSKCGVSSNVFAITEVCSRYVLAARIRWVLRTAAATAEKWLVCRVCRRGLCHERSRRRRRWGRRPPGRRAGGRYVPRCRHEVLHCCVIC